MKNKDRKVVLELISKELSKLGIIAASTPQTKATGNNTHTQAQNREPLKRWRLWHTPSKQTLDFLGLIVTVIALLTFFFSFFPHLTVSDPTTLNEDEFFSKSFTISNDGILPVFRLKCGITIGDINRKDNISLGSDRNNDPFGITLINEACHAGVLSPGDAFTFTTEPIVKANTKSIRDADFGIIYTYVPLLPPLPMQHCVHFTTYTDSAGKMHWFRSPGHCDLFRWLHPSLW
jgi:hypothetical protein